MTAKSRSERIPKKKQLARKSEYPRPFVPTPESAPGSTIGAGRPNAASNLSGAPTAAPKPTGIEEVLTKAIASLTDAVKSIKSVPRGITKEDVAEAVRADQRQREAEEWNSRRSAAQRLSFTFHPARGNEEVVSLGKSPRAIRMQGARLAPAPTRVKKSSEHPHFNDTYMRRRNIQW
jgi:hypothetical protein